MLIMAFPPIDAISFPDSPMNGIRIARHTTI
jgi:hypothetical protein